MILGMLIAGLVQIGPNEYKLDLIGSNGELIQYKMVKICEPK